MVAIPFYLYFMGVINQLITRGHHLVSMYMECPFQDFQNFLADHRRSWRLSVWEPNVTLGWLMDCRKTHNLLVRNVGNGWELGEWDDC